MGGGLMQLVAYGAQDIYLTGNPQITFFKVVYRRHTNFSMETIEQTINGTSTLTSSATTGTVTVSRNGDLLSNVYVSSSTAAITSGDELVNEVVCEIGGQQVDKHTKEFMQIWNELNTPESKALALKVMTGCVGSSGTTGPGMVQVPLRFWFCNNPGLALPLIALQYHEVKLKFTWGTSTLVGVAAGVKVWSDYVYLDTDERRRFAQVSHEYLIEQMQYSSNTAASKLKLNFNHPVKEIIWTDSDNDIYSDAKLTLNGHDRFAAQESEYFQLRQPYQYHTAVPTQNLSSAVTTGINDSITLTAALQETTVADINLNTKCIITTTTIIFRNGVDGDRVQEGDILVIDNATTPGLGATVLITRKTSSVSTVDGATGRAFNFTVLASSTAGDMAFSIPVDTNALVITRVRVNAQTTVARTSLLANKINCYSFALKPEEHQPSGTCNFSRIDTAYLQFGSTAPADGTITVYALNYNVLRIMSGMGGLAYSN